MRKSEGNLTGRNFSKLSRPRKNVKPRINGGNNEDNIKLYYHHNAAGEYCDLSVLGTQKRNKDADVGVSAQNCIGYGCAAGFLDAGR